MKTRLPLRSLPILAGAAGLLLLSGSGFIQASPDADAPAFPEREAAIPAEDSRLAWVDPVITGPVSPDYRRLREQAGCDEAVWPNIPAVCFPK